MQEPLAGSNSLALAIGVMTHPANAAMRGRARHTWLADALQTDRHRSVAVVARFVVGNQFSRCKRVQEALAIEHASFHDIAYVQAPDCHKGFGGEKVHAWYAYALATWPEAKWLAKMEDDGMLRMDALTQLVFSMPRDVDYAGFMQWQATCSLVLTPMPGSRSEQPCAGCWAGYFTDTHARKPWIRRHRCTSVNSFGTQIWPGSAQCPAIYHAPFACGPFELRSVRLANTVSSCKYANDYFTAMSRRSLALPQSANPQASPICSSTDGSQALPSAPSLSICILSLHITTFCSRGFARRR